MSIETVSSFDPVKFTADLIKLESCDPPGGELNVARLVANTLTELGIENKLDEFSLGRANVIGTVPGNGEKKPLVFSAHLDTLPIGNQKWKFSPFAAQKNDGKLYGRGASDMKSAVAAFVGAANIIKQRNLPLAGDLILAFTAGESANCLGARKLLEQGFQSKIGAFLCGEPSNLDIVIVEKAALWLELECTGKIGHISGNKGTNAVELMSDFIRSINKFQLDAPRHPLLTSDTINVGRIYGGKAVNLTPDKCVAEIDVRFGPGISAEQVIEQISEFASQRVSIKRLDYKPAIEESSESAFAKCCYDSITRCMEKMPTFKGVSYYSDGAILLDGLDVPFAIIGPGEIGMSGQTDEYVLIENILKATEIYAKITEAWLQ